MAHPKRFLTLLLLLLQAIGYDMDYTLVQYDVESWEGKAYVYGLQVRGGVAGGRHVHTCTRDVCARAGADLLGPGSMISLF